MSTARPGLVDIAREFLAAHALMRRLFAKHRAGSLRFQELEELVGDDEGSVLFRLKERCHASFRTGGGRHSMHREALFDLAVGSLFHEAMKFRENFYQREVYGPRVEALRSQAGHREAALFDEFTRIQESVSVRLAEGLVETETLLARTVEQLFSLWVAHREDPLVARFLVDNAAAVEEMLSRPFADALAAIYGDTATGYALAGRSLLASGYYPEAIAALGEAAARRIDAREIGGLVAYARGMQAYLARDYEESVERLSEWADTTDPGATELLGLAHDAVSRIGQLAEGSERQRIVDAASALLVRLGRASP
jgi:tetratricopeptide (TPR) repeat protein